MCIQVLDKSRQQGAECSDVTYRYVSTIVGRLTEMTYCYFYHYIQHRGQSNRFYFNIERVK